MLAHLTLDGRFPASLVGPLYTVAMFGAESLWGRVGRLARNRKDAASTMIKAVSDIASAAAMVFSPHALQSAGIGPSFLEQSWLGGPPQAAPEDAVLDAGAAAADGGCIADGIGRVQVLDGGLLVKLHTMYLSQLGGGALFKRRWDRFLRVLAARVAEGGEGTEGVEVQAGGSVAFEGSGYARTYMCTHFPAWLEAQQGATPADRGIVQAYRSLATVRRFKRLRLGSLTLGVNDWFLSRPSRLTEEERASLWFGNILSIFQHKGPDGMDRIVLQVIGAGRDGDKGAALAGRMCGEGRGGAGRGRRQERCDGVTVAALCLPWPSMLGQRLSLLSSTAHLTQPTLFAPCSVNVDLPLP